MTSSQVNRLVSRLLDLGVATGYLLLDSEDVSSASSPSVDFYYPSQLERLSSYQPTKNHTHRPGKLFRKLFQKKHGHNYSSAPVSPLHTERSFDQGRVSTPNPAPLNLRHHEPLSGRSRHSDFEANRHSTGVSPAVTTSRCEETSVPHPPLACLIPEQDLQLHDRLGVGSFAIVRRADWSKPSGEVLPVAVKLLHPNEVAGDLVASFLDELRAMQCLSHPNLILLHGVVLSNPIMLVTELAPLGSLLLHLRAAHWQSVSSAPPEAEAEEEEKTFGASSGTRASTVPRALQADSLWDMAVQVARGMAYLSARGLVHRDLACRNLLLSCVRSSGFPLVKIGDFGLVRFVGKQDGAVAGEVGDVPTTKEAGREQALGSPSEAVYVGGEKQRIPFAWCAPESLGSKHLFSQASDVWSWAVTCWEMWTGGAAPWSGFDAARLFRSLEAGQRLTWPRISCPRRLYQLMLACWRWQPQRRPTFTYLASRLDAIRPFAVIAEQSLDEADRLGLEIGDTVVVIDGCAENFWWRGQNQRTGEIGSFPRAVVRRSGARLSAADIGRPNPRSFVHAGHMGANGRQWGHPDKLDIPLADATAPGYPDSITYAYAPSLLSCNSVYQENSSLDKDRLASERYLSDSTSDPYDQPDDDKDERILLDNTNQATIGWNRPRNPSMCTNEMKSSVQPNARCDADGDTVKMRNKAATRPNTTRHTSLDCSNLPSVLETTETVLLRPPPGPDEGVPSGSRVPRSRQKPATAAVLPSSRRRPVTSPSELVDATGASVEPSAPPLIDLYSPVPANPTVAQFPAFTVPPKLHPDVEAAFCYHREEEKALVAGSTGGDADLQTQQLAAICHQVPGSSFSEARRALSYLSNPFVSISQYLDKPALPSAPPSDASATTSNQQRQDLVPLAVRLLLANRLASFGLSDWSTGCRVLTVFHWNLASAADWLAERLPNQRK